MDDVKSPDVVSTDDIENPDDVGSSTTEAGSTDDVGDIDETDTPDDADDARYRMVFEVSERARVVEALEAIAGIDDELSVREVHAGNGETATVRTDDLTDKQREALVRAVDAGYYDTPRQAALDDLCDELGISKSAVSQRLRKAESTIVKQTTDGLTHEDSDGSRT